MEAIGNALKDVVKALEHAVWGAEIPGTGMPWLAILLLATGVFLTLRMGFIQLRKLGHATAIALGKYDDPNDKGDISHFQALTTALSATVGIGNIAGVALAIHYGGPGAIFWMWVVAALGMCTKYTEVSLAMKYREFDEDGNASGGPHRYIVKGLGPKWKPLAFFFAGCAIVCSWATGNMAQMNTLAKTMEDSFGLAPFITGIIAMVVVAAVILGGIKSIGKVTSILAPAMAALYVLGAMAVLAMNASEIPGAFGLILSEAFNPTSGFAGTAAGAWSVTLLWGVKRGLFSNEAGQGSAPIAHSAAKSHEPLSEGLVALLEPFIDTILICTMTALVILTAGIWDQPLEEKLDLGDKEITVMTWTGDEVTFANYGIAIGKRPGEDGKLGDNQLEKAGVRSTTNDSGDETLKAENEKLLIENGRIAGMIHHDGRRSGAIFIKNNAPVLFNADNLGIYDQQGENEVPWTGELTVRDGKIDGVDRLSDTRFVRGASVRSGAALTTTSFERALGPIGRWIVTLTVILFAISTAISWSYYGDRCTEFLFGVRAIIVYRGLFLVFVFVGATSELATVWLFGDVTLGFMTVPNLIALLFLAKVVRGMQDDYFSREHVPYDKKK